MNIRTDTEIGRELCEEIDNFRKSISQVMTQKNSNIDLNNMAYVKLCSLIMELIRFYNKRDKISKSHLNEIYTILQIVKANSIYAGANRAALEEMGRKIEYYFICLLRDKLPENK